ncbi:MAG: hypothetical protein FWF53_12840 [Candidatus Azobacteroides sp.]|nr:hypothetical protein [Candidatus Azobacteroides sp.]
MAYVEAKFYFQGSEYDVEDSKIGFIQDVDHKGQPQRDERGGQIIISLSQIVEDNIYEWAKNPFLKQSGTISFETGFSNAPLRVEFFNAYCIGFTQIEDAFLGTRTNLVISPSLVLLNGIDHKNFEGD